MASIVWTPHASDDYEATCFYLERQSPRDAEAFATQVTRTVERLSSFPHLGRMVPEFELPEIREVLVQGYRVVYRFDQDRVEILTVRHGSRLLRTSDL
jgi:toxin ParE1/3/4